MQFSGSGQSLFQVHGISQVAIVCPEKPVYSRQSCPWEHWEPGVQALCSPTLDGGPPQPRAALAARASPIHFHAHLMPSSPCDVSAGPDNAAAAGAPAGRCEPSEVARLGMVKDVHGEGRMSGTISAASSARSALQVGYRLHPVLAAATGATAAGVALIFPLQALDPVQVNGVSVWAAPFDLFGSMALLCGTVLWLGHRMGGSPLFGKVGLAVAAVAILEPWLAVLRVVLEPSAALGAQLGAAMALVHLGLFGASVALAVELFRKPLGHPTLGWSVRLGMLLTLCGMAVDPARGLPALLSANGDWGPASAVALHAVQLLPVAGWALSRRRELKVPHQLTLIAVAAVSYAAVMLVLCWQAARGPGASAADPITVAALVVVVAGGASSTASVLAHAREVRHLALEARTASQKRQAARAAQVAQTAMARARRAALQQRVTQGLLSKRGSEKDRGAVPGATLRIRHPIERLSPDERPTEIAVLATVSA